MSSSVDVSLYELVAQSSAGNLPFNLPLQVSPATLKSMSDLMVNLLVEQKIPALVWAKLPRGDVWWTALERYAALGETPRGLYWFKNQREDTDETSDGGSENPTHPTDGALTVSATMPLFSVQLSPDHPLRQEYFLVIQSEQFCAAVFAQRVSEEQVPKAAEASLEMLPNQGQPSPDTESSSSDRKQLLTALYSFDAALILQSLTTLETAIEHLPEIAAHWQPLLSRVSTTTTDPAWHTLLLSKHIQQQEDLWQRNLVYRKQADLTESLRLQNEELVNTIRLKDDFLNTVGQELRTPLTTIKTALSLLGSPNIKLPQRQRYLDLISKECDRQSSLITSLLDLVHLEQIGEQSALPAVQISDVVPGVVSTYLPLAEEKGVRLGYTISEHLPPVSCLSSWLKQITINLLHNGIKFTSSGGQVWVRTKQQGDYIQLEVSDTGIGIAQNEIPKIFDRFYRIRQATDDSSGAGLGLTVVQQLLLHCGGSISVKSRIGEGSTFNVLLPIHRISNEPMLNA
jgi:two-component system, OmpR family, phosphate regulon sensor histidine kinase PhoR